MIFEQVFPYTLNPQTLNYKSPLFVPETWLARLDTEGDDGPTAADEGAGARVSVVNFWAPQGVGFRV